MGFEEGWRAPEFGEQRSMEFGAFVLKVGGLVS